MLKAPIYINGFEACSAVGHSQETVWENYQAKTSLFTCIEANNKKYPVAQLPKSIQQAIAVYTNSNKLYAALDPSVKMVIWLANILSNKSDISNHCGINIGSSRGATHSFEQTYSQYLNTGVTPLLTSPTTTLGNIASWVAQELNVSGIAISHSITCSSAMHALLNGISWLQSGMASQFLVGGSEAALTPYTLAQMDALKLYACQSKWPNRTLDFKKTQNTLVLGEAAALALISLKKTPTTIAKIIGVGFATERLSHAVSLSPEAHCFKKSMQNALHSAQLDTVDAIVMHAPGTVKGDQAEYKAIQYLLNSKKSPFLTSTKWLSGHTFAASGLLSLQFAILSLQYNQWIAPPYIKQIPQDKDIRTVLINAVGFGGNAVSIIIKKP